MFFDKALNKKIISLFIFRKAMKSDLELILCNVAELKLQSLELLFKKEENVPV